MPDHDPVLVTGATGYLAGWVIKLLLDAGHTVHGTVRDPDNLAKVGHLLKLAEDAPGSLRLFKANLLEAGSHDEAMAGCRTVIHTASPFVAAGNGIDAQRDIVDPALKGTRDVLETVNRTESVSRVVVASSTVAVVDITIPDKVSTEADWHETTTLEKMAYPYSKVLAEREAWRIAQAQDRWRLVVINPAFIVGPCLGPSLDATSFKNVKMMSDGTHDEKGAPPFEVGMVDVRDVAEAHLHGAFLEQANGRNILFSEVLSLNDMAQTLKAEFGENNRWHFPPDTPWNDASPRWRASSAKALSELGMTLRSPRPAICEMFRQIYEL